jgi:hypothetical protein
MDGQTKKLTPKQQRFVQEYLVDFNGAAAAIRAGYSKKTAKEIASENLTKPNVLNAVVQATREATKKTRLDVHYVLTKLELIIERHESDHAVLRALELLGKYLGMWSDGLAAQFNNTVNVNDNRTTTFIMPPDQARDVLRRAGRLPMDRAALLESTTAAEAVNGNGSGNGNGESNA